MYPRLFSRHCSERCDQHQALLGELDYQIVLVSKEGFSAKLSELFTHCDRFVSLSFAQDARDQIQRVTNNHWHFVS